MEMKGDIAGAVTLTPSKSKLSRKSKRPENVNPNVNSPNPKVLKSPALKSASKSQKSSLKKPNPVTSPSPIPRNKIRERKFVVAKKNSKGGKPKTPASVNCKCKASVNPKKCLCVAYETLRASQDEFFKIVSANPSSSRSEIEEDEDEEQKKTLTENPNLMSEFEGKLSEGEIVEAYDEKVSAHVKRRDKLLEVARQSIPKCGRVMHLVKAFENALTLPKSNTETENEEQNKDLEEETRKVLKWELPGLRPRAPVTEFSSPDLFLTPESLGLDSRISSCSSGSSHGRLVILNLTNFCCCSLELDLNGLLFFSISNRNSGGGRHSRRSVCANSLMSSESTATFGGSRGKRRTLKATPQQPFKLKTEQRGRSKQEEFMRKVQEMMIEQEKQRIPVAQGLPWTTDEPQCLARPPVKESTRPVDVVLHSNTRAVERADFDNQVQEKLSFIEQFKLERERQEKLAEEEELRRLRKVLVPKAQPMPYFDKPFIPKRSEKQPTLPKEPKFHNPQHKKMFVGH
ncbi:TPX2-like protein [Cynara cardunculus var. scolymus]|uniref:TPX2-like protein n=1 Tax=Cynara cardunculus var. scolymus TaxID=59895 RepID=A0A118K5G9_CYNCS|nr:TPX2-like protein [Cynara cardunculus var. scolymus]